MVEKKSVVCKLTTSGTKVVQKKKGTAHAGEFVAPKKVVGRKALKCTPSKALKAKKGKSSGKKKARKSPAKNGKKSPAKKAGSKAKKLSAGVTCTTTKSGRKIYRKKGKIVSPKKVSKKKVACKASPARKRSLKAKQAAQKRKATSPAKRKSPAKKAKKSAGKKTSSAKKRAAGAKIAKIGAAWRQAVHETAAKGSAGKKAAFPVKGSSHYKRAHKRFEEIKAAKHL